MKIPQMIAAEFRRLTANPMSIVALVALMCVPVLYGGLYLWANQNPYANLDRIPAAIVVDDAGATVGGKDVSYGDDVAKQLVSDGSFQWHRVEQGSAARGVDDSKYDFSITFPKDFSTALASASGTDPHRAIVTLTTNDTNSYLASTIGTQAAEKIRTAIVQQVNEEAAKQFLVGLADIRSQLVTAVGGADTLVDGSASAQSGASLLADGTAQLASGSQELSGKLGQLAAGAQQVSDGAAQVAAGNRELATQANQAGAAAAQLAAEAPATGRQLLQELQARHVDSSVIAQVQASLASIDTTVQSGNRRIQSAVGQIDQLSAGADQVAGGASQVAAGSQQAADGASQLASGAATAASGSAQLRDGLTSLHTGTAQLRDGLQAGVGRIPDSSPELRQKQASTIADPVDLKNDSITSAGTYGAGLAPFFVSLAAWIGIYALFLIVKPVSRRAITALHSPVKITLAGWLTPGLLGAVQMIGLFAIVSGALGFRIDDPLGMYAVMGLASVTFAAIILALNVWLGSVGQFLGLVLMVMQLVTAGGTFPWQTLPGPLAALHHVLPMSYAVDGLRQLMYGGNPATAWSDAGVLALWMLVALLISAIGVTRMTHFRTLRDLRPSLIG
ncbi:MULTISPECIES: YhgE/Pip family protein [unclassified Leifsonia]|uniref:YhgE/Pip family protein n=1 Tax=unclassified Leifsonia TaxID=2663824 RepID=UPI0008A7A1C7|nr:MULTISPECIES: YhgE/Pip family protein [unclassified Leifsonia]SEI17286.1 putative membrane protein [Leifsonia sp. CL154]SFM10056.1 putative membrane protein [Leifsonia sp. CL147]